jgi:hypothetical protein
VLQNRLVDIEVRIRIEHADPASMPIEPEAIATAALATRNASIALSKNAQTPN